MAGGAVQLLTNLIRGETLEYCPTDTFCDDPRDTYYIRLGATAYDNEHK